MGGVGWRPVTGRRGSGTERPDTGSPGKGTLTRGFAAWRRVGHTEEELSRQTAPPDHRPQHRNQPGGSKLDPRPLVLRNPETRESERAWASGAWRGTSLLRPSAQTRGPRSLRLYGRGASTARETGRAPSAGGPSPCAFSPFCQVPGIRRTATGRPRRREPAEGLRKRKCVFLARHYGICSPDSCVCVGAGPCR